MRLDGVSVRMVLLSVPFACGHSRGSSRLRSQETKSYQMWDAQQVQETLHLWEAIYPDLIRVTTSQERYGLQRAGTGTDCVFEWDRTGCSNYFFTIQDFVAHPEGSRSSQALPEVFWSGSIHGDEKLGVTVVMETASLLLEAALCESKPRYGPLASFHDEVLHAKQCRDYLRKKGIDDDRRKWLARLVTTRRIVVVPALNALGFDRKERKEASKDPLNDLPYNHNNETSCMETIAARTVNEMFREHMFRVAVSFHEGDKNSLGFSWGSKAFGEFWVSPDKKVQSIISEARDKAHRNSIVDLEIFELNGTSGMGLLLDWAYASSWDSERLGSCKPITYGGYSPERVLYNNSTHRAIAVSVSTKFDDLTESAQMGLSKNLFHENGFHFPVTRNIRLALASADLVEPYISIISVGTTSLSDDLVPLAKRDGRICQTTNAISVPVQQEAEFQVEWTVGGGFTFTDIGIWYAKWDEFSEYELDCMFQPELDVRSDPRFHELQQIEPANFSMDTGVGESSPRSSGSQSESFWLENATTLEHKFRALLHLSKYVEGDRLFIIAGAKADQDWAVPPDELAYGPRVHPQSHLINGRTNIHWNHKIPNGKRVQGRLDWYSTPVTIILSNHDASLGTMHANDRFQKHVNSESHSKNILQRARADNISALKHFGRAFCAVIILAITGIFCFAYRHVLGRKQTDKITTTSPSELPHSDGQDDPSDTWRMEAVERHHVDDQYIYEQSAVKFDVVQEPQTCHRTEAYNHLENNFGCMKGAKHLSQEVATPQNMSIVHEARQINRPSLILENERRDDDNSFRVDMSISEGEEVIDFEDDDDDDDEGQNNPNEKRSIFSVDYEDDNASILCGNRSIGIMHGTMA